MKQRTQKAVERCVSTLTMLFAVSIIIVPLLIMIFGSFKTAAEAQRFNLELPKKWLFSNYVYVVQSGGIARALFNSITLTACVVVITIMFGAVAAFVVSRKSTRYTKMVYNIFVLGMVAPMQVVTTFMLLKLLGIMGSFLGVTLVMVATQIPWTMFMYTGFIKSIPKEIDEAAFMDGAGALCVFFRVVLPLLTPIVATTVVTTAMAAWNEFMVPLYFFNTPEKWTMPLTVFNFFGQYSASWNYVFADLVLTALPITLLYLYSQKYIVSGMTAGAIKG